VIAQLPVNQWSWVLCGLVQELWELCKSIWVLFLSLWTISCDIPYNGNRKNRVFLCVTYCKYSDILCMWQRQMKRHAICEKSQEYDFGMNMLLFVSWTFVPWKIISNELHSLQEENIVPYTALFTLQNIFFWYICGFQCGVYSCCGIYGYATIIICIWIPTFWNNMLTLSSSSKLLYIWHWA
jgi:hypothetical protein